MKVLIADDDPMYRRLLEERLRGWGYEPVVAGDGEEAWQALRDPHGPRVALLDWSMPGMNGVEICRRLKKAHPNLPFVYTIMVTGRDGREDMLTGLESGADDYLAKPVDSEMLRTRLAVAKRIVEAVPPQEWALPRVPGYEVVRLLGKGMAGTVWEAIQTATQLRVALKIIRLDLVTDAVLTRFEREIRITQRLDHPNIARIYDSRFDANLCYYAMELIEGKDLGKYTTGREMSLPEVLRLMVKVCDGVEHAHRSGVVHRDLKPQNILLTADGEPKVVDFGLAKTMLRADVEDDGVHTLEGVAIGTPVFMAPEQARGLNEQVDARTDVYALAVILYILLARHHPHKLTRTDRWEILRSIADGEVRPPSVFRPDIDPRLEAVLLKALARDPEDRYPTAGAFGADLSRFLLRRSSR